MKLQQICAKALLFILFPLGTIAMKQSDYNPFPLTSIVKDLPASITRKLAGIITYRFGVLPDSNMITTAVVDYLEPGKTYRFTGVQLEPAAREERHKSSSAFGTVAPPHLAFEGEWSSVASYTREEANVLGASGTLFVEQSVLEIPTLEATAERLAYYNAQLVEISDVITVSSPELIPLCMVHTGRNYPQGYLGLAEYGGGFYLETHATPHFWAHVCADDGGAVILGKQVDEHTYHLSAFTIPYGKAIYAPGGVIHNDGFLNGEILVAYTVTEQFSTVVAKKKDGDLVPFTLVQASVR
jgi:hypothetical protein